MVCELPQQKRIMDKDKSKIGEFHFVTEPYLLDFRGRVTIPMIGNYLIHVASSHAAERGFGFNDMSERHTAWVLSRLAIEMIEYPAMSEPITLYTWVDEVGRLFTSRCFELVDGNGKTFGYARSIWAAIDVETRRPTLLDIARLSAYVTDRPCPIEKPGKIAAVENEIAAVFSHKNCAQIAESAACARNKRPFAFNVKHDKLLLSLSAVRAAEHSADTLITRFYYKHLKVTINRLYPRKGGRYIINVWFLSNSLHGSLYYVKIVQLAVFFWSYSIFLSENADERAL